MSGTDKCIIGTITVSCLQDLNKNTKIEAYAIKGDNPPTLAGVLMLVKNNRSVRQKQNIALIYMHTDITGFDERDGNKIIKENSIPPLYCFLHQNLLYGLVETVDIDVRDDIRFKLATTHDSTIRNQGDFVGTIPVDNGKRKMVTTHGVAKVGGIFAYLKTHKLPRKYHKHIKNYIFEEIWAEPDKNAAGFSPLFAKETILFDAAKYNSRACAHETGHAMGLPHTFLDEGHEDPSRIYYFKEQSNTDNIMSYNFRIKHYSTWYWQWKIINNWIK